MTLVLSVSRLMGHHSAEFTLRVYAHLIPGDEPEALDLDAELGPDPEPTLTPTALAA